MIKASWIEQILQPAFPIGTSKGMINARTVWYLSVWHSDRPHVRGIGEAALFPGHSMEKPETVRAKLKELCTFTGDWYERLQTDLVNVPCVRFAVEQCLKDLEANGTKVLFPSSFTLGKKGIPINGLVWMGDKEIMRKRLREQIEQGNRCVKMKIGAIGIEDELEILRQVREEYTAEVLTIRVDANGAFNSLNVSDILDRLAELRVESIEQPVPPGQYELLAQICANTPIPIALDEDLIGVNHRDAQIELLDTVKPQYIVIKPSLVGGWKAASEWIDLAHERNIRWWVTSALESNIGLNAIAQWVATLDVSIPQGLGTGKVYTNNVISPLTVRDGALWFEPEGHWDLSNWVG